MLEHSRTAWYEWIDSDSNPADGLSRDGVSDQWTMSQGWELTELPPMAFRKVIEYMNQETVQRIIGAAPQQPILPSGQ